MNLRIKEIAVARSSPIWKERCVFGDLREGEQDTGARAGEGRKVKQERDGLQGKDTKGVRVEEGRRRQKVGWRETDRKRGIERQLQRDQETRFPRRSREDKWSSLTAAQG